MISHNFLRALWWSSCVFETKLHKYNSLDVWWNTFFSHDFCVYMSSIAGSSELSNTYVVGLQCSWCLEGKHWISTDLNNGVITLNQTTNKNTQNKTQPSHRNWGWYDFQYSFGQATCVEDCPQGNPCWESPQNYCPYLKRNSKRKKELHLPKLKWFVMGDVWVSN